MIKNKNKSFDNYKLLEKLAKVCFKSINILVNYKTIFLNIRNFILDAIKPVEDNNENIIILNETINKKHEEIKQRISEIDQYSKQLSNQSHEIDFKFNNTINVLKGWFLFKGSFYY